LQAPKNHAYPVFVVTVNRNHTFFKNEICSSVLPAKNLHRLPGHEAAVFSLCRGFDNQHFFSGGGEGWVVEWNLDNPDPGRLIARVETQIFSLAALPGQKRVVAGNMHGGVHWIDLDRPEATRNIAHHQKGVFGILPLGDSVFTIGGEGRISRWSANEGRSTESAHLSNQSLRCLDYCPQRNELAVGASDNRIYLLDADTLNIRHSFIAHANSVFAVRYAPDGSYLLSGGRDAHLIAWNLDGEPSQILSQPAHWYTVNDIAFSPDGALFATASRDKTIKIWDASSFQLLKVLDAIRDQGHLRSVNALLWPGPLVSAGDDRSLIFWGEA
jgi:WD40 repeat protein